VSHHNLVHDPFKPVKPVKVHTTLIIRDSSVVHGMVALEAQPDYFPNSNDIELFLVDPSQRFSSMGSLGFKLLLVRICKRVWLITVQRASAAIPLARRVYTHKTPILLALSSKQHSSYYSIVINLVWQTPLFTCQRGINSHFPLATGKVPYERCISCSGLGPEF
jgi:hypothetical protein